MANKKSNRVLVVQPNDSMMYPSTGYSHPVYEVQNGMMMAGGPWGDPNTLLRFVQSGPGHQEMELGGYPYTPRPLMNTNVTSINNIRHQPYPEGHSNPQNGYSTYANGGQFLPAPLEYALLANGGYVDKYSHGGIPYYEDGGKPCMECGGKMQYGGQPDDDGDIDVMKKGGHWIPKHLKKGRCTPLGNPDCRPGTPQYNLAVTFKKHHGFHKKEYGGLQKFTDGGEVDPWGNPVPVGSNSNIPQDVQSGYDATLQNSIDQRGVAPVYVDTTGQPTVTGNYTSPNGERPIQAPMSPTDNSNQIQPTYQKSRPNWAARGSDLLGAGLMTASYFENQNAQRQLQGYRQNRGLSANAFSAQKLDTEGSHGDYDQYGNFRPSQYVPVKPGIQYAPMGQYGGQYQVGNEYEMDDRTIEELQKKGYKLKFV